ncbi:hypothetical protein AHF37_01883 [Paragonimus kellicotti]|nr:hypothetical protein AHF37_01883 [Paragonimus kellicotti]
MLLTDFCRLSPSLLGCYAFCCYFCVLHQLTKALKEHTCLPCLPWCGLLALRVKMRTIYGIHSYSLPVLPATLRYHGLIVPDFYIRETGLTADPREVLAETVPICVSAMDAALARCIAKAWN